MEGDILQNALIFLGVSLLTVPIAKRLGIGSVLGYLLGGIFIGPYVLGWIGKEGEDIMHAAEFGVVMMLFVIGLELNPASFWKMRKSIVGMGSGQMISSSIPIFLVFYIGLNLSWQSSLALALTMAMSSTAIVLQTLKEKNLGNAAAGKSSFSILLFQDIAVIPILALIPLLATNIPEVTSVSAHETWVDGLSAPMTTLVIIGVVTFILLAGKYAINPALHWIAKARMRELFTTSALFIVIGVAWLMEQIGISAALGTFLAGVMLANSEFRHELESDIDPFKGILLGLFFTAVGSTVNFDLIFNETTSILLFVGAIMAIKAGALLLVGKLFKQKFDQLILLALLLCQMGEFAFVLVASISSYQLIAKEMVDFLVAGVTLSMLFSPIFLFLHEKLISPKFGVKEAQKSKKEDHIDIHNPVIIAGFGHFGNTLGRFLRANGVSATILDHDSNRVAFLRKMGFKVYYGDATRVDLLEKAGIAEAKIFISALDSPEKNNELVDILHQHFPHVELYMRSKNRSDAYELLEKSVKHVYRESLHTSVQMGVDVLERLGYRKYTATRKALSFIKYDEEALSKLAKTRKEKEGYILQARKEIENQERLLNADKLFDLRLSDHAWDNKKRTD
ncbi:monovalent cation:proton antiporter-2 (CPA2) family protein [Lunatimonas salinarum]|uniref:monovalent cation:proton antiporter-2 (CPA2) family protein n=1 Tax=Lunatimonas salinarum TaxID=1774590 RepID=UPI001ADF05B7|nr:monovalent cation:proton antiporter-2 (CPA2) family protein [Lunatimonas salinarum]